MFGLMTLRSRASPTLNMNVSSPSLHDMHAASLMNTERVRCFGSAILWKIKPMLNALTNTAVRLWQRRTKVPVRQLPTMDRVPYPIVVCVATLKITAALNPSSNPDRQPGR